jgi:uroporphyrinogen decarboxylase
VAGWQEFERFDWPQAKDADLSCMEQVEALSPENMRAFHVLDVWEVVRDLIGFEQLCLALYDDRALVEAVFEKVGSFALDVAEALCDFSFFGALYIADDLGYKTGLMIDPDTLRTLVLPWHRKLSRLAKAKGKLVLFHSCGAMYDLIDDYIEDVGIDAKHSFEDAILPVTEAKKRFGDRLSLLGGVDVDALARSTPDAIRDHTRAILSVCQPGGGYCLGSGNWVTEYVDLENYLAMLGAARAWRG